MAEFDELAKSYDQTRGGERRGDEYAAAIDALIPPGDGPILDIGVGTGVVALGLARRGRTVIGLDVSRPMLSVARPRLGSTLVESDAMQMAIATASVAHALSVWVVQSVVDPVRLFEEAARVLVRGGTYIVCPSQRNPVEDAVGRVMIDLAKRIDTRRGAVRPRAVTVDQVMGWAAVAGLTGSVHEAWREWMSSPADELDAIAHRIWPALRELDEEAIREVTAPTIEALKALPQAETMRRAVVHIVVLRHT